MRIIRKAEQDRVWVEVGSTRPGTSIRFMHPFHQDVRPEDIFIVNQVCGDYQPFKESDKVGVTNLRTGKLSYVSPDRSVTVESCYVAVENLP